MYNPSEFYSDNNYEDYDPEPENAQDFCFNCPNKDKPSTYCIGVCICGDGVIY